MLNIKAFCLFNDLKCPKTSAFLAPKLKPTPSSYTDIVKFTACRGGGAQPLRVPCSFGHLMSVIMNSFNRKCAIWFLHYGLIILCDHETDCNNADTILTPCQLIRAHYCSLYSGSNIQWLEYPEKQVSFCGVFRSNLGALAGNDVWTDHSLGCISGDHLISASLPLHSCPRCSAPHALNTT